MPYYRHRFTVTPREGGVQVMRFPVDMLRYDRATPATEKDSGTIETCFAHALAGGELAPVQLVTLNDRKDWQPETRRWESFGWEVALTKDPVGGRLHFVIHERV